MEELGCLMGCAVPDLADKICVGQGVPGHALGFPSMSLMAIRWRYEPEQEALAVRQSSRVALWHAGNWIGTLQLRIATATQAERYTLEEAVTQAFMQRRGAPGVIVSDVVEGIAVAFELESSEWDDEKAFDQNYGSTTVVTATVPMIVCRDKSYDLRELRLLFVEDVAGSETETRSILNV